MDVKDKLALVTGASHRLGREIAAALARSGARVIAHARQPNSGLHDLIEELGGLGPEAHALFADLADSSQVTELAAQVHRNFGPLDILVNNAAVFYQTPLAELSAANWDEVMNVNLKAPFMLSLFLGRRMKAAGRGKIINIGDIAALRPYPAYLPYCVSKAGLLALTQGMARVLAPEVQVTCIAPGPVLAPTGMGNEALDKVRRRIPLGRFGSPEDVAHAVIFLVRHGDYMTGSTLFLDGGRLLT